MGVAVAVRGGDAELERFAEHAEDDRVLARVVAGADGVVADFVARPLAGAARAAVACAASGPSRSATIWPKRSAVPLGASSLKRWCRSMISTSTPVGRSRSASAAISVSFIATLTAVLMLGDQTMGILLGRFADVLLLLGVEAGRGDHERLLEFDAVPVTATAASGTEKSITTSASDSPTTPSGTPISPTPAISPASWPNAG